MKVFKKIVCTILVVLMLVTSAPMQGFVGLDIDLPDWFSSKAEAVNVNYCSTAAAQWAKDHLYDYYSVLYNKGYWDDGGDCANFVSQCLYMGGLDMNTYWNISGYYAHWGTYKGSDYEGSYIRCQQLYNYLVKIGAQVIKNPKASDVSIGDVILYSREGSSRMTHTAIVIDIKNGTPVVAAHSTGRVMYRSDEAGYEWHLGFKPERTYLMKMNGSTCVNQNHKSFDVYVATGSDTRLYKSTSTSSGYYNTFLNGSNPDYAHVYKKSADGAWGYTFRYGSWGWIRLSNFKYLSHQESPKVSHNFCAWTVVQAANCSQDGYDKRTCTRCGYEETRTTKGGHVIDPGATCLSWGYCKICGEACEAPLDHDWDAGTVTTKPTCTTDGVRTFVCKRDSSHTYTAVEPKLGHNYATGYTSPTCTSYGEAILTCTRCSHSYVSNYNVNNAWTDWTTDASLASTLSSDRVKTKTQYRYYDKQTTTSYETSLSGWTQNGGNWVHQSTNSFNYASFPSGFDQSHSIYASFHKSCDVSAYTYSTTKREVSTSWAGYVYWHWMYDTSYANGTSTRAIYNQKGTGPANGYGYKYFGAFTSSNGNYSSSTGYCNNLGITNYIVPERTSWNDCQGATRWFRFDYYSCTYKDYKMLFNYWKWGSASAWQDSYVAATNDRKVETRTLYSYNMSALGHNFTTAVDDEFVATDDVCYVSGKKCSRCGVYDPNSVTHPHNYPTFDKNSSEWSIISKTDLITVYRAYCRNGCGKHIEETENNCVWIRETVEPTCTTKGYVLNKCTVHPGAHNFTSDEVAALGHDIDPASGEVIKPATCTEDGIYREYCCRYDKGLTCNEYKDTPIPAFGHTMTKYKAVTQTCLTDGQTEYYQCETCRKFYADNEGKTELQQDEWIIKAAGAHVDKESVEWELVSSNGCGVTGYEIKKCNRVHNGETCNAVIDERDIPEIPADYYVSYADNAELVDGVWKPTSCLEDAILYITCRNCEHTDKAHSSQPDVVYEQEPLDRLPHASGDKVTIKEAYCIYPGQYEIHCTRCATLLEEGEIPAPCTEHALVEVKADGGCVYNKCTNSPCAYTEGGAHNFQRDTTRDIAPTCTEDGLEAYTCTKCMEYDDIILDMLGHDHKLYDTIDPKCTEGGYSIYKCQRVNNGTVCGDEYSADYTEPIGHNMKKTDAVDPLCTVDGNFEYYTCQRDYCQKIFFDENGNNETTIEYTVDPQIGHAWDNGVIDPESTCKLHGTKTYTCQNDNSHKKTESVELNPNNHVGETYIKDDKVENCTDDGYTGDKYCSDCDALLESGKVIDKLGHDMGKWSDNNNATHTRKCQRDNGCTYTETVNCTFGDWVVTKEATCTEKGSKERICTVCGYKETAEITLKAHTPGEAVIENRVEPKCEEKGSYDKVVYCTECPKELSREKKEIKAIGHDWGEWKTSKDATIDAKGEEKRICRRDSSHIETRETDKLIAYTAYFIKANNNGSFEYNGKKYDLVDTVKFAKGTKVIVNPDVPQADGFIGYWEDYTLEDKDIYIEAVYELKSSDNQSDLKSDKDVVYKDGVATITLSAFAETLNAKVPMGATPYDIILVMDQSSSMTSNKIGKETRLAVLERVAKEFVNTVYDSAVENNVDHRVALVSFSGTKDNCKGTGIIGINGTIKTFNKLTDADYASAFIDVKDNLSALKNGIDSLTGIQGTSSDYGLQMAKQILANNQDGREKLVLFITDGEPGDPGRNMGAFNYTVANEAIEYANQIKNLYGTTIYSIGVAAGADPSDETDKINKFLHYVSSNYPEAKDMDNKGTAATMKNYFLSAEDSDEIAEMFESIVSRQIVNTISFTKVNFYDTVSEYFTLTTENENALRETVKAEYGVSDNDIIITRNDDGTTTVRINNLIPKAVFDDNNVQIGYGATVKFDVTANEKTLEGGIFVTNTEDAGIENDGKTVIEFKVPEGQSISSGRAIVEFRIGDEVYAIREVSIGDKVVVPETDVADWVVTGGTTVTSDYTVFNTEYTSETRTVRWIIDGNVKEEVYHIGEIIFAPEFAVPDGKLFKGWNLKVPYRMPDYDLEFTAVFESHEHNYKETAKNGECTTGIVVTYTCDCGSSYNEAKKYDAHNYTANVQLVNNESVATMSCTVCGKAESKVINYKAQYDTNSWWNKTKVVDLTLYDNAGIAVQPDGYIYIKVYSEGDVLSNAKNGKLIIKRVNENDTEDNIPYLNNSSTDSCGYYVDGNYIVLKLDHFSYYALVMPEDAANVPSYGQIECAFNGHSYTSKVVAPTCTVNGYTTYTCTICGDTYNDAETVALGHSMGAYVVTKQATCTDNGIETSTCSRCDKTETKSVAAKGHNYKDGVCTGCGNNKVQNCTHMCHKSGFMGFIWKIVRFFWKLFKMNPVCECGVKHY